MIGLSRTGRFAINSYRRSMRNYTTAAPPPPQPEGPSKLLVIGIPVVVVACIGLYFTQDDDPKEEALKLKAEIAKEEAEKSAK
ncbi:hypothetical protein C6P40_001272 [Pichia californica]|uniref:Uncharacterized protein n=1 Tax=Pichia californica TaxID=460514 RepID=A0A9P7BFK6_9ASCO|nr:hypothetical protein C6P40_001272 [[Candida] californica]